jgi:predicted transcriptional regulator
MIIENVRMRGTGSKPGSRTVWHGLAIRQRAHGATVSEIAATHGVHPQTVRQVLRRGGHGNAT